MKHLITLMLLMGLFTVPAQAQRGGRGNYHRGYNNNYHKPVVVIKPRVYIAPRPYYYHPYHPVVIRPVIIRPVPVLNVNVNRPVVYTLAPEPEQVYTMNDADFTNAVNSINNQNTEDSRLAVAEEVADANYFTSAQVKQILGLFYTDGGKLAFAEYAYDHVADQNNYYIVNDAFSSEKTVQTLSKYLSSK
jgi:hypothetical protein